MNKTKLTLKDVAEQLGVSTATISNAFNRPDQLSKAKREEIFSAVQKDWLQRPQQSSTDPQKGHIKYCCFSVSRQHFIYGE